MPRDFRWDELTTLLTQLGFVELPSGRTAGSRKRFSHHTAGVISLHRPHPGQIVKRYALQAVRKKLEDEQLI